jgi:predicted nucleic acid-binding protein
VIFLDTNLFLRHLAPPSDALTAQMQEVASAMFLLVESGALEVTTSEVVLHEVLYLLTARNHYDYAPEEAIELLEYLIQLPGFRFSPGELEIFLRALSTWRSRPSLGFADSVIAARCEANGWELATFDQRLGSLPSVTRWQPTDPA